MEKKVSQMYKDGIREASALHRRLVAEHEDLRHVTIDEVRMVIFKKLAKQLAGLKGKHVRVLAKLGKGSLTVCGDFASTGTTNYQVVGVTFTRDDVDWVDFPRDGDIPTVQLKAMRSVGCSACPVRVKLEEKLAKLEYDRERNKDRRAKNKKGVAV